ncbi:MAG: 23S rRNA (guanosine(2251)-2'-O)-methyltransferase RlmB [Pseudobdellovibrionaceae bacterium]
MKKNFRSPSSRPTNSPRSPARSAGRPSARSAPEAKGPNWPRDWRAIIGQHAILEVFKVRPKSIKQVWLKQGWESSQELKELGQEFKSRGLKIEAVPAAFLDKVSPSHQGAAVFSDQTPELNWEALKSQEKGLFLVLDGIEDPQNLGAILRTAWLMGVAGVMTPEDRSVGLTSTVHKVACGGVEHVPLERTSNFSNPLESLKKSGYWVFGLSHEGERSLFDLQIPEKVVWCIGSEEKGLRSTTERLCDELVRIPQLSAAASYNASVATAIALTETYRQQSQKKLSN